LRSPQGTKRPDADTDAYRDQAAANLKAGRIRLVFVTDEIPRELRRVVEFLNEQMAAEVIAIEVKQYVGPDGPRTLLPRVPEDDHHGAAPTGIKNASVPSLPSITPTTRPAASMAGPPLSP
jgi:hypothetical protein